MYCNDRLTVKTSVKSDETLLMFKITHFSHFPTTVPANCMTWHLCKNKQWVTNKKNIHIVTQLVCSRSANLKAAALQTRTAHCHYNPRVSQFEQGCTADRRLMFSERKTVQKSVWTRVRCSSTGWEMEIKPLLEPNLWDVSAAAWFTAHWISSCYSNVSTMSTFYQH